MWKEKPTPIGMTGKQQTVILLYLIHITCSGQIESDWGTTVLSVMDCIALVETQLSRDIHVMREVMSHRATYIIQELLVTAGERNSSSLQQVLVFIGERGIAVWKLPKNLILIIRSKGKHTCLG